MLRILMSAFMVLIFSLSYSASITINTSSGRAPISPYIYGTNQELSGGENFTLKRFGGNRTTGYNWENNYSNAGEDWYNTSDTWLCGSSYGYPAGVCNSPGGLIRQFHQDNIDAGIQSIITLPLAGYVAADQASTVTLAQTAPSSRWKEVVFKKGSAFVYPPDLTDGFVYVDEEVNHLVTQFGGASGVNGVKFYNLDNEPALWSHTHPRIHPTPCSAAEYVQKSIDAAKAVKDVDPDAQTAGGVLFGWSAYFNLMDAPDWGTEGAGYSWYFEYYLDKMRQAGQADGRRLLDMIDLHYYSEARGAGCRVVMGGTGCADPAVNAVQRMSATRTLWENNYHEDSWIGIWNKSRVPLIPKLIQAINTYYPGTKIAITEHSFGGGTHYSGGIAVADTLGIFGKYGVYLATYWDADSGPYTSSGFRLFRNYDGSNGAFGDTKVQADSGTSTMSVYAAINGSDESTLHIIITNKFATAQSADVSITSGRTYTGASVWGFDSTGSAITVRSTPVISGNSFSYSMPAYSAYHFILDSNATPTYTPVFSPTATPTITQTHTNTPDFTATNTPVATPTWPPEWIENCEDGDDVIMIQQGRNGWWFDSTDGTATQLRGMEPGGPAGSSVALHYSGSGFTDWGSGAGFNFRAPSGGALPYDASEYDGIKFWARVEPGSDTALRIILQNAQTHPDGGICGTGCWDAFGIDFTLTTAWAEYTIPFSAVSQQGWGFDPGAFNPSVLYNLETRHNKNLVYDVWLDDFIFYKNAPPTHTPTRTATLTATPTPTFTPSGTETATATPSATDTPAYSPTHTGTITETITGTPPTASPTFSFTENPTLTNTPQATHTATVSETAAITPTRTPTAAATPSASVTNTPAQPPTPQAGVFSVTGSEILPNPYNPGNGYGLGVNYYLSRGADSAEIVIYTNSFRKVLAHSLNPTQGAGDKNSQIPSDKLKILANGMYFYTVKAVSGNETAYGRPGVLLILR